MWHHTVFLPKHMHQDSLSGCVNLPQLFDPAGALSCVDSLAFRGTHVSNHRGIVCALFGTPQLIDDGLVKKQSQIGLAQCIADLWVKHGEDLPSHLLNGYSLVIVDGHQRSVFLAVDKFAVRPLCYQLGDAVVSFSDRADCVGEKNSVLDPQALYDYLYFHMIPAPRTVFKGVLRLPASHSILITPTGSKISRHWPLNFTEMKSADLHVERDNVRALIDLVVADELPGHERVGAFLSGGIDS